MFGRSEDRLSLVVFDAPVLAGEELAGQPWHKCRGALEAAVPAAGAAVSLIDVSPPFYRARGLAVARSS